jgi:hypothetical protein
MVTHTSEAVIQARSVREQLKKLSGQASGALLDAINALDKKVAAILEGEPTPSSTAAKRALGAANGDAGSLYDEVGNADAAPTVAQLEATTKLEADVVPLLKQWDEIKAADLLKLNRQLHAAKLLEVRPNLPPEQEESENNEE